MRTVMRACIGLVIVTATALFTVSPGYSLDLSRILGGNENQDLSTFKLIHVADLKSLIADNDKNVSIYDANVPEIRQKFGVIPGAKLLSSDDKYDLSVLPSDKDAKLVFYCANTQCMASHQAARRAIKAGYKNVNVMADGIAGWKAAGQPTVPAKTQANNS
jgi:rhodanese-related sulfurtransferase